MVRVKICGLTRAEDVEKAIEYGADALGFVFEPSSPRYVGNGPTLDLTTLPARVEPYVFTVAVYGDYYRQLDPCVAVQSVNRRWAPDYGSVTPNIDCRPSFPVLRIKSEDTIGEALKEAAQLSKHLNTRAVVLDAYDSAQFGGTGKRVDWEVAAELVRQLARPIVLAGGLNPDNVGIAIQAVRPYAVDVSSGIEASPGIKDHAKMRDFIQAAKESG